jgi:hypothetical protein
MPKLMRIKKVKVSGFSYKLVRWFIKNATYYRKKTIRSLSKIINVMFLV